MLVKVELENGDTLSCLVRGQDCAWVLIFDLWIDLRAVSEKYYPDLRLCLEDGRVLNHLQKLHAVRNQKLLLRSIKIPNEPKRKTSAVLFKRLLAANLGVVKGLGIRNTIERLGFARSSNKLKID